MQHPGLVASMQPLHIRGDAVPAEENLGTGKAAFSFPFRDLLDMNSTLIFGSNWPIVSLDPLAGIHTAVTRKDAQGRFPEGWLPHQKISVVEAIAGYTSQPAKVSELSDRAGELAVNAVADLTVLDRDITSIPPEHIPKVKAVMTVVNGRIVFEF
jgi:predicted amidohydrolase YtcJ